MIFVLLYTNAELLHGTLKLSHGKNQEEGFINLLNVFWGVLKTAFYFLQRKEFQNSQFLFSFCGLGF